VETGLRQGWEGMLALGANFNLVQSQNLVGQMDGFNILVGGAAAGQVAYVNGPHEVRGALLANLAWARTPLADNFIKTHGRGADAEQPHAAAAAQLAGEVRRASPTGRMACGELRWR
jgi:hypothetical protein